jgi:hypothetical protein
MDDSRYTFTCCGVVAAWEFYVKNAGTIQFQVWRPAANRISWTLVGENTFTVPST